MHRGLAVRADEIDVGERHARAAAAHAIGRVGERLAQQHVEVARARRRWPAPGGRSARAARARTAWSRTPRTCSAVVSPDAPDLAQRGVGAVGAGAGQQADHQPASGARAAPAAAPAGRRASPVRCESASSPSAARDRHDRRRSRAASPCARPAARARARPMTPRVVHDQRDLGPAARLLDQLARRRRRAGRSALRTMRTARAHSLALVGRTSTIRPP